MFVGGSIVLGAAGRDLEHTALGIKKGLSSFFTEKRKGSRQPKGHNGPSGVTVAPLLTVASPGPGYE